MIKTTTITEALAELKTIDSKIETTKNFVLQYAIRQGTTIDPLADDGGSDKVIPQKIQSLTDLLARKVSIRTAINKKNLETQVNVGDKVKSVAEWIIWRREAKPQELKVFQELQKSILNIRQQCQQKGLTLKDGEQPSKMNEVSCFISESKVNSAIESLNEIETTLDGKLSMINATTLIEY